MIPGKWNRQVHGISLGTCMVSSSSASVIAGHGRLQDKETFSENTRSTGVQLMGCDYFYDGCQKDFVQQQNCYRFIRSCFAAKGEVVEITPKLISGECHSVHISDLKPMAADDVEADIEVVNRVVTDGSSRAQVISLEKHRDLAYFGIVPWSINYIRSELDTESDYYYEEPRLQFVFHSPSGELCTVMLREWFPSREAWRST